jgi:hypothetical protein
VPTIFVRQSRPRRLAPAFAGAGSVMLGRDWPLLRVETNILVGTRREARRLAVKLQETVVGQSEAADGRAFGQASMGPVPVVTVEPDWELLAALV